MIKTKEKKDIKELSFEQLTEHLKQIGEKPFRANQLFEWIYRKGVVDFGQMTNLSGSLRKILKDEFSFDKLKIIKKDVSSDRTTKVLFELCDKEKIETVLIPTSNRCTVCISTQAGCKFGCRFCASGIGGWKRNLSSAEILDQILYIKSITKKRPLSHVVFMGVGEPLDNYDNLIKAIRIINSEKGMNIAARRITVSTCGVLPKIKQMAKEGIQIELAVSLHGFNDESRGILMPVNRKYPFSDLIQACREYNKETKRQITFEYILIKDITCTEQAAIELGKILKGLICKMNLIPYNKVSEFDHQPPSRASMFSFKNRLAQYGIHSTIRLPRGRDVAAACGQLRHNS